MLPAELQSIKDYVFNFDCTYGNIYIKAAVPPICGSHTFDFSDEHTLYVPKGCREAYASAAVWREFGSIVEAKTFPTAK